ncbi:MAG: adenylosuccinate synthetase, partial [Candidatus Saccharimonadales bacterium]
EFGTTTGRARRVGWLDLVQLKYSCQINGFDGLVVTKLDVLSGMDNLKVCIEYDGDKPVYKEMAGWGDVTKAKQREDLPKELIEYIELIEEFTDTPVAMFSTSPDRKDTYGGADWS